MSDHPLTDNGSRTIAQASISCRLDYCNSLLYGISDSLIRLQSVQNAAARLVTGTRRSDHITPVLRQLHWLPVRQLIHFRIDGWVSGHWPAKHLPTSPTTAAWYQTRAVADSALLSSDIRIMCHPSNVYAIRWQKFFSCWSSSLERSSISALRAPDVTFGRFKRGLKTYLFTLVWWDLSA